MRPAPLPAGLRRRRCGAGRAPPDAHVHLSSARPPPASSRRFENEGNLFFRNFTQFAAAERMKAWDRKFSYLKSFPQVIITPHSAFATKEALQNIAGVRASGPVGACTRGALLARPSSSLPPLAAQGPRSRTCKPAPRAQS